jgi:hypothetical protein
VPRPWPEYSAREWRHLRPLVERYKYARYQARVAAHVRRSAAKGDVAALRSRIAGQQVLVAVAFDDPGFVERQIALVRRNVPGCLHLIADNSADEAAAARIEAAASSAGCAYVKLRPGPWRKPEDGGRSHALAMNWVWRNLLRPARPAAFGFIDHDIFPMRPTDPFAQLGQHAVVGQLRNRSGRERWYLWAGFCFFRFDAVQRTKLNFSLDWAAGLDSGGANWFSLYRRLAPADVLDTGMTVEAIAHDLGDHALRLEWIGAWLHLGNFNVPLSLPEPLRRELMARKQRVVDERLAAALKGSE